MNKEKLNKIIKLNERIEGCRKWLENINHILDDIRPFKKVRLEAYKSGGGYRPVTITRESARTALILTRLEVKTKLEELETEFNNL